MAPDSRLLTSDDLTAVVRVAARQAAAAHLDSGWSRLLEPIRRLGHLVDSWGRRGNRRSIAAHYDLGDDFFAQFLDPTMMYSAAVFPTPETTLEEASLAKLDLVCRKLDLGPADHLVEIGTGWGGLAVHAASRYGCRVTTTTISRRQLAFARRRVETAGLGDRVRILDADFRDLPRVTGRRFSKLASIEMIEAVVHRDLDRYFRVVSDLLEPDGLALVQAITIADQRYDAYRRSVDFIQRHIFPGGQVPAISAITASMKRATDLTLAHLEDLTPHYARTLAEWRRRFVANRERIAAMGYPERFRRLWEFYFCYCEGGFLERTIGDVQLLFTKPLWRGRPVASAPATGGSRT